MLWKESWIRIWFRKVEQLKFKIYIYRSIKQEYSENLAALPNLPAAHVILIIFSMNTCYVLYAAFMSNECERSFFVLRCKYTQKAISISGSFSLHLVALLASIRRCFRIISKEKTVLSCNYSKSNIGKPSSDSLRLAKF